MYRIIRFDRINLEYANQVENVGSGTTPAKYITLPEGGAIDAFGNARKRPGLTETAKTMRLYSSSSVALESLYFQLLGVTGTRGKIYRRTKSGLIHWMYGRLTEISAERSYEKTKFNKIQDLSLRFVLQEAAWRGIYHIGWTLDSGIYLDDAYAFDTEDTHSLASSPDAYVISVGSSSDYGRAAVKNMIITVDAGNAEMSNITIARTGGESLVYAGAIPSGGSLVINTGTMQVTCTGVSNAYNNMTFSPTADMAAWFTLQPGDNTITVTYTGGGTGKAISVLFSEAWY